MVDKYFAQGATKYYEMLLNYVCCLYVTLYGEAALRNVQIKTGIRSVDLVRNVNDELCTLVADAQRQNKPKVWKIYRVRLGGANLVGYNGFAIQYGGVKPEHLESNCEQIAPCLFRDKNNPDVLCYGIGYLTSLEPQDGSRIYGTQVISKPAMNCLDSLDISYTDLNVRGLLARIAGSGVCILQPQELVELLNRYFMIRTANENKQRGCIYCGRTGCQHFKIPREFKA